MDNRLTGLAEQDERKLRRAHQRKSFHRNQAIGILLLALGFLVFRLLRTPSGWIFPPGWWRLW